MREYGVLKKSIDVHFWLRMESNYFLKVLGYEPLVKQECLNQGEAQNNSTDVKYICRSIF